MNHEQRKKGFEINSKDIKRAIRALKSKKVKPVKRFFSGGLQDVKVIVSNKPPKNYQTKDSEVKPVRNFDSGATRDTDEGKLDYEGFLCPFVLERYAQYMHSHRKQADGKLRASDNWKKGIPKEAYMKSMWRHFHSVWKDYKLGEPTEEELCALLFNVHGLLYEELDKKDIPKRNKN